MTARSEGVVLSCTGKEVALSLRNEELAFDMSCQLRFGNIWCSA